MTASHAARADDGAPSLVPLISMLAAEMERVDATILERMDSKVPLIPQLAGHLIASGGKRMRPMMTIAGAMLGSDDAAARAPAVKLATAVEFIHSATLLHDDVIDESKLRRGRDTANALWGNDAAVLVGDFLFARAFELMVEAGDMTVLGRLAAAAARITEGEIRQMAITGRPDTSEADYLDVIEGKTAVLFSAAAAAGIEITGAGAAHVEALRVYGMKLGMAFQIMDDITFAQLFEKDSFHWIRDPHLDMGMKTSTTLSLHRAKIRLHGAEKTLMTISGETISKLTSTTGRSGT